MGQGYDTRTLLFADRSLIVFALLLILLLSGLQCPKFLVPVGLERIRYQPVRRVHVKVAPLCQVGFIPGALDLLLAQTIHLIQSGLHLLLDGQRDFQGQGSDCFDEKLADGLVQVLTKDMLAYRDDVVGSIALASILGHDFRLSRVVADGHSAAADATDSQALQQRRALARGTLAAVLAVGVSIIAQALQVLLILPP